VEGLHGVPIRVKNVNLPQAIEPIRNLGLRN
jgi:hypothetical protein